jgi:hypothetical protein
MQYVLYYVICFKVWGTTREVFVANDVDTRLANCKVFTQRHAHDTKVASTRYKRANGIPSPFSSDTWLILVLIKVLFWFSGFKVTIYLWSNHIFTIMTFSPF